MKNVLCAWAPARGGDEIFKAVSVAAGLEGEGDLRSAERPADQLARLARERG